MTPQSMHPLAALMDVVFEIIGGDGHDGLKNGAPSIHWVRSLVTRMHGAGVRVAEPAERPPECPPHRNWLPPVPPETTEVCERCGEERVPVLPDTMNEIRLGVLPSVNLRNGVAFSYCPECGTEAGPSATRVPVLQPEPSPVALNRIEVKLENALAARHWPDTLAQVHAALEILRAVDSVSRSPEQIEAAARALWRMGNARIGERPWETVAAHYIAEATVALEAAGVAPALTVERLTELLYEAKRTQREVVWRSPTLLAAWLLPRLAGRSSLRGAP